MNEEGGEVDEEDLLEDDELFEDDELLEDDEPPDPADPDPADPGAASPDPGDHDPDALEIDERDDETTAHRSIPGGVEPGRDRSADDVPTGRLSERSVHRGAIAGSRRRKPSTTTQQDAALYDTVVVPQWCSLFGGALIDRVPSGFRGQALDAGAGTGYPSLELVKRMDAAGRIVAIERDTALLDLLRRRAIGVAGKQLFARVESFDALSFGDEVFDLVVACAVPGPSLLDRQALAELHRVMVVGGRLLASVPLSGTFEEVLDMFREVALRREDAALAARVEALAARDPSPEDVSARLREGGFERVVVDVSERQLVFRSARDVFTHPVLRYVALAHWRHAAGFESGAEDVLLEVEQALATYLPRGPISLAVRVGVVEAVRG